MNLIITNIINANTIISNPNGIKITHIVSIGADHAIQQIPKDFDKHPAKKIRLEFFDISSEEREGMNGPSRKDIELLINFYKEALRMENPSFLIHCYAGKSRSTAAGLILLTMFYNDANKAMAELLTIKPEATPNGRMIKLAGEYFNKGENGK